MVARRARRPTRGARLRAQAGFAADASHELRTPLAFIRSGVEVLSERDPELGREVLADVDYLTGLTQRLLVMARAESGSVSLDRTPIDVGRICRSAARRSEVAHADALTHLGSDVSRRRRPRRAGGGAGRGARERARARRRHGRAHLGHRRGGTRWSRWSTTARVCPPIAVERAFERFFRADPSRAAIRAAPDSGCRWLARSSRPKAAGCGSRPTPGGGITARVALPLAHA